MHDLKIRTWRPLGSRIERLQVRTLAFLTFHMYTMVDLRVEYFTHVGALIPHSSFLIPFINENIHVWAPSRPSRGSSRGSA